MIVVKTGDLLTSSCHGLVNTVNCVGVMGKGVALAFKKRYPRMYEEYAKRCDRGEVVLGQPYPYAESDGHIVINFPTKQHWRAVSRLSDITSGLQYLREHYREWGIRSLALPPLGCGNGQLEWRVVGPTLYRELEKFDVPVELYAPQGTPVEQMQLAFFQEAVGSARQPEAEVFVEPGWVAVVDVLRRIDQRKHRWPVGRIRFQKIAYFLSILGVPTGLEYERAPYGPYAPGLKHVESRLINNGLLDERKVGNMIEMRVGRTFEDARAAFADDLWRWDRAIERVADLFGRMNTQQTEIAATVHMVATQLEHELDRRPTEREVLEGVLAWKARRQPTVRPDAVRTAIESLALLEWIDVEVTAELHDDDDDELLPV